MTSRLTDSQLVTLMLNWVRSTGERRLLCENQIRDELIRRQKDRESNAGT